MADQKQAIIRPQRSDLPNQLSPNGRKDSSLPRQKSADQEDSQDTVKTFTPLPSLHDNCELHAKDATTPVVAGSSPLPSPPVSPPSNMNKIPASPRTDFTSAFTELAVEEQSKEDPDSPRRRGGRFDRRANSQRLADKNRRTQKKNKGVVIGDFNGLYGDELSLNTGEEIEIISKDTVVSRNIGWWTGRNNKGKIGIFPAACVSCELQGSDKGSSSGNQEYPLEIKNSEIEMKEVIGIGGFGKVYRAIYKGEEVAVKVAKTTTYDSLKAVQDVIAEAEKFAHLAHVNICALVGVVLVKDVCLVMECAQGGALSDVLHKSTNSIPIDVIIDWASQIASGMHYLHHEADPSLIHRDLKTSNILLAHSLDSCDLRSNTIKITDFGLAREIEHTTHMSGAGTYPWMAPEIIRTSNFSKKSDVWSFAVVLWEMVTGEKPYNGLSFFVVAYGVGHGTLTLPIPESCPEPLSKLMNDCWSRDYTKRPSFVKIVAYIREIMESEFCHSTSHEEFKSLQTLWKGEIQKKFVELKKMELELERREVALQREIQEQEKKKKELEEEKKEMRKKKEEYECLIRQLSLQHESESTKNEDIIDGAPRRRSAGAADSSTSSVAVSSASHTMPLTSRVSSSDASQQHHHPRKQQQQQQQVYTAQSPDQPQLNYPAPLANPQQQQQQQNILYQRQHQHHHQPMLQRGDHRPPRVKPFSVKKFIRKLMGTDISSKDRSMDNPLPDRMEAIRTIRRITSTPGSTTEKRGRSRSGGEKQENPPHSKPGSFKRQNSPSMILPNKSTEHEQRTRHKRRSSDGFRGEYLDVDQEDIAARRGSVPNSPNHLQRTHQTIIANYNQFSHTPPQVGPKNSSQETDRKARQRSLSDLRSPSPQYLLPSYYSSGKLSSTTTSSQASCSLVPPPASHASLTSSPHPLPPHSSIPPHKPSYLGLLNPKGSKKGVNSQESSSPGSPNVTVTPAEQHPLRHLPPQYDSGKDSMTCSDASGHSNSSEKPMIELDSPVHFPIASSTNRLSSGIDDITAQFDPLRQSTSHDSLLESATQDRIVTTSPTLTPTFHQHHLQLQQRQLQLQQHQQLQQMQQQGKSVEALTDTEVLWGIGSAPLNFSRTTQVQRPATGSTSTSPKKSDNLSPKQSLTTSMTSISSSMSARSTSDLTTSGNYQNPPTPSSIVRPRPRPSKDVNFQTISAPSSRPHSPKMETKQVWDFKRNRFSLSSPTGSVKSMQDLPYDSDCGEYYLDSNSSSLINLSLDVEQDTMVLDEFFNCFLSQN